MTDVAWIETVPEDRAEGELAAMYAADRDPGTGRVDHVLKVHSLHPATLADHATLYHTIMHAPGEVGRTQREMIGVVVSQLNDCGY
jgi:alkylhydroperoxidase family enzyme